jgi:hypothetical protein
MRPIKFWLSKINHPKSDRANPQVLDAAIAQRASAKSVAFSQSITKTPIR